VEIIPIKAKLSKNGIEELLDLKFLFIIT